MMTLRAVFQTAYESAASFYRHCHRQLSPSDFTIIVSEWAKVQNLLGVLNPTEETLQKLGRAIANFERFLNQRNTSPDDPIRNAFNAFKSNLIGDLKSSDIKKFEFKIFEAILELANQKPSPRPVKSSIMATDDFVPREGWVKELNGGRSRAERQVAFEFIIELISKALDVLKAAQLSFYSELVKLCKNFAESKNKITLQDFKIFLYDIISFSERNNTATVLAELSKQELIEVVSGSSQQLFVAPYHSAGEVHQIEVWCQVNLLIVQYLAQAYMRQRAKMYEMLGNMNFSLDVVDTLISLREPEIESAIDKLDQYLELKREMADGQGCSTQQGVRALGQKLNTLVDNDKFTLIKDELATFAERLMDVPELQDLYGRNPYQMYYETMANSFANGVFGFLDQSFSELSLKDKMISKDMIDSLRSKLANYSAEMKTIRDKLKILGAVYNALNPAMQNQKSVLGLCELATALNHLRESHPSTELEEICENVWLIIRDTQLIPVATLCAIESELIAPAKSAASDRSLSDCDDDEVKTSESPEASSTETSPRESDEGKRCLIRFSQTFPPEPNGVVLLGEDTLPRATSSALPTIEQQLGEEGKVVSEGLRAIK